MATITLTPASGSITAKKTVVRVDVAGADTNDTTTYNALHVPTEDAFGYYLLFDAPAGTDDKKSYKFNVGADGKHVFNNFVFDAAGTWTVRFRNAATDGDVATASVVVA
jgi:hypothetical protein